MSLGGAIARRRSLRLSPAVSAWSTAAWCAIGVTALFIALTAWWLTQDHATPSGDAAEELWAALRFREYLLRGDVGAIFDYPAYYPPYGLTLGGLAAMFGGTSRNAVVLGENLVCVPLLALSCYRVGRRAAGSQAGALAVVFALGAPLVIEQFHVFMIDVIMATVVALTVWAVLASERFSRTNIALAAGVLAGIGTGTKEHFPLYVTGLVIVVLARGGWRHPRGVAAFLVAGALVGAPWYVHNAEMLSALWNAAGTGEGFLFPVPPLARPPLLSSASFEWYGWATLNGLLFAPLTAFALAGVAVAVWHVVRRDARTGILPELLGGLVGAWLLLTFLTHKDMKYTLSLIVYLAVLGTAWIVQLPRLWRGLAVGGLAAAVVATTIGATFGVGGAVPANPPGNLGAPLGMGVPPRDRVVVYANHNFLVAGPRRDGDLLEMLRGLASDGVREVFWDPGRSGPENADFNGAGLTVLARTAGLSVPEQIPDQALLPASALLIYARPNGRWAPCVRFADGRGVWALVEAPDRFGVAVPYCPGRGVLGPAQAVPLLRLPNFTTSEP